VAFTFVVLLERCFRHREAMKGEGDGRRSVFHQDERADRAALVFNDRYRTGAPLAARFDRGSGAEVSSGRGGSLLSALQLSWAMRSSQWLTIVFCRAGGRTRGGRISPVRRRAPRDAGDPGPMALLRVTTGNRRRYGGYIAQSGC